MGVNGDSPEGAGPGPPTGAPRVEAQALLPMIWADPQHMPEQLAMFAVRHFGRRAAAAAGRRRRGSPGDGFGELSGGVIAHGTRVTIAEGAVVGGPFVVLIPVAFVAALLAQAQMVLELAVLSGHDPESEDRVVDLLVLQSAYPSAEAAREALAGAERRPHGGRGRVPRGTRWRVVVRMAAVLGIIGPRDEGSRLRRAAGTTAVTLLFLLGLVFPLVWLPCMAWLYRKASLRLGARAATYYTGSDARGTARSRRLPRVPKAAGVFSLLRLVSFAVTPVVLAVLAMALGARVEDSGWIAGLVVLVCLSLAAAAGWVLHRRHRRAP
ncbi:hypothetical protein [Streptomyces sp. NPDC053367]|uniref:hypothetical protein n=1 Tax=Streptomyces sp. NPDC053367 TaxID=3365700 RepID=UPI0037D936DF